jgi:hypothetical protein
MAMFRCLLTASGKLLQLCIQKGSVAYIWVSGAQITVQNAKRFVEFNFLTSEDFRLSIQSISNLRDPSQRSIGKFGVL